MKSKTAFTPLEIKTSNRTGRRFPTGLTRKDLIVVLGCVAFMLANLGAIGSGGRESAKRAVCLNNLRKLTLAWTMYADDNEGRIVNGLRGDRECKGYGGHHGGTSHPREWPWVCDDYSPMQYNPPNIEEAIQAIKDGALFPYTKNVKLYKCPTGKPEEVRTYALVDSMNAGYAGVPWLEFHYLVIKDRRQIKKPAERAVFIDEGNYPNAGWTIYYDKACWYSKPPKQHAKGTTFSFADGHSEYWKWKDPRTTAEKNWDKCQPGNPDLHRAQEAVWGQLGYEPSPPP